MFDKNFIWHAFSFFIFLKFLTSILCSLSILRFFIYNCNKSKKCSIEPSLLNLVKNHFQSETEISRMEI